VYFCDRNRRYRFGCGAGGLAVLRGLVAVNLRLLARNEQLFQGLPQHDVEAMKKQGYALYEEKPTLQQSRGGGGSGSRTTAAAAIIPSINGLGGGGATGAAMPTAGAMGWALGTWSDAEYALPGFQWMYLRLKSFQRFAETWTLLERCAAAGLFHPNGGPLVIAVSAPPAAAVNTAGAGAGAGAGALPPTPTPPLPTQSSPHVSSKSTAETKETTTKTKKPLRVVSLGGGPGYELLAFDWFSGLEASVPTHETIPSAQLDSSVDDNRSGGGDEDGDAWRLLRRRRDAWLVERFSRVAEEIANNGRNGGCTTATTTKKAVTSSSSSSLMLDDHDAPQDLELVSLDLQQSWDRYVEELGYGFRQWDVHSSDSADAIVGEGSSSGSSSSSDGGVSGVGCGVSPSKGAQGKEGEVRRRQRGRRGGAEDDDEGVSAEEEQEEDEEEKKGVGGEKDSATDGGEEGRAFKEKDHETIPSAEAFRTKLTSAVAAATIGKEEEGDKEEEEEVGGESGGGGDDDDDANVVCFLSNILCYCTDDFTADLFAKLLGPGGGVRCILANERGAEQRMVGLLERRGIVVKRLLDQRASGRDDRQLAFFGAHAGASAAAAAQHAQLPNLPLSADAFRELTFPNQPYEEKKYRA
jgi:hypothetical protein